MKKFSASSHIPLSISILWICLLQDYMNEFWWVRVVYAILLFIWIICDCVSKLRIDELYKRIEDLEKENKK